MNHLFNSGNIFGQGCVLRANQYEINYFCVRRDVVKKRRMEWSCVWMGVRTSQVLLSVA